MSYGAGMRNKRIHIFNRKADKDGDFGRNSGGNGYKYTATVWSAVTFNKGVKSLREGALDAYDTVMFRCRFIKQLDRWCLLKFKGKWYQITSFNDDYQDNQIQITATELANQQVNIVEPYYPSASVISGGSSQTHEVG
jgi:head-tail adaptor